MTKNVQRIAGVVALVAWWLFIVVRMWMDAQRDPGPTGLPNDIPNWHNRPGHLQWFATCSAVELLVVLLILRPHTYARSWRRALAALALLTPWTFFFMVMLMHSGGIMYYHVLWLLVLWSVLALLALASGIAAFVGRRAARLPHPEIAA